MGYLEIGAFLAFGVFLLWHRASRQTNSPSEQNACIAFAATSPATNGILIKPPSGPVLMLDFDGVLHPGQSGSLQHLPMLESWLRDHPNVEIIISSNWRDTHSFAALQAYFAKDLQPRVIGTTPNLVGMNREDEILSVISDHGIRTWAALDDRTEEFPRTGATHLVATDYLKGITSGNLTALTAKLLA